MVMYMYKLLYRLEEQFSLPSNIEHTVELREIMETHTVYVQKGEVWVATRGVADHNTMVV